MNLSGSRQKPRVMPGNGLRQTSSPTSPVPIREAPRSSTTSIAIPRAGPPTEQGLIGAAGGGGSGGEEAGADLGAAGAVDHGHSRAADVLEEPPVGLRVPRLAGRHKR